MPSESPQVRVEFTPEFKRNLRALSRKYRHIRSDVQPVIEKLQAEQIRRILTEFDEHVG